MEFRATLNVLKFNIGLNPMFRIYLNFTKRYIIAYCVTKVLPMCSPVIGQFFHTMIEASIDKECL